MRLTIFTPLMGLFVLLSSFSIHAQKPKTSKYTASKKGKLFISWGGNRETYSKSDIHFKGENYNFTIENATAKDKPKGWHVDYINPSRLTIPQTNAKIGYFISNNYSVSIGVDHMKYVMERNKTRTINGFINLPNTEDGSVYNGTYNNENTLISKDFLKFEHTDGLNYVYAEFSRHDDISSFFKLKNTDKFQINISEGISGGFLLPKTNATLLLKERYDQFHLSGYGIALRTGVNFTFFKHFFLQLDLRGGYINMNNIRTTNNSADKASQKFTYLERIIAFGGIFKI